MKWFREEKRSWLELLCINILKCGPIPKHLAFILDGNRRYALKKSEGAIFGHTEGFKKLTETLQWCLDLGINEVTVYAFSIENFNRSEREVKGLMDLAREKFKLLLEEKKSIMERSVCIRVIGNISLLPEDIQRLIAEVVYFSKNNNRAFLNVCFAYTSRDEITNAIKELSTGVDEGSIEPSDITESLLEQCLYTSKSNPPDLVIRTSGEVRLSDFLLWQSAYSVLIFVSVLWPEFSIWHLFIAVLKYQRQYHHIQHYKEKSLNTREKFLLEKAYDNTLKKYLKLDSSSKKCFNMDDHVQLWMKSREERVKKFLVQLERKREKFIEDMQQKN